MTTAHTSGMIEKVAIRAEFDAARYVDWDAPRKVRAPAGTDADRTATMAEPRGGADGHNH